MKGDVFMLLKSTRIYTEGGLVDGFLRVEDGKIAEVISRTDQTFTDYGSLRIIPGIFDTHNHGTLGYGLMGVEGRDQQLAVRGYRKACASQGLTSVFPTASVEMLAAVAQVAGEDVDGADITGIHSEGPWLNRTGEKGIWQPWPEVSLESAKKMVADSAGLLRLVALAPEIEGIDEIITYFLSQGITLSYAHSDMGYADASKAYATKGITVATHTGNVMTGMHHRDIGGLGASLLDDNVMCEVICDGMHISLPMLRIYFRIKDYSRFMMISDCSALSGAPVGKYTGFFPGTNINVTPDGFALSDEGRLCGSTQPVLFGVGNLVEKLGIPMEIVTKMASLNPCRKYGLDGRKGSIRPGKDADFVIITDDYKAQETYVRGRKVYDAKVDTDLFNPAFSG